MPPILMPTKSVRGAATVTEQLAAASARPASAALLAIGVSGLAKWHAHTAPGTTPTHRGLPERLLRPRNVQAD